MDGWGDGITHVKGNKLNLTGSKIDGAIKSCVL